MSLVRQYRNPFALKEAPRWLIEARQRNGGSGYPHLEYKMSSAWKPGSENDPDHLMDYNWERWWEHGEYDGTSCSHCRRERVMLATAPDKTERRVCEKCGWDQVLENYAIMYEPTL